MNRRNAWRRLMVVLPLLAACEGASDNPDAGRLPADQGSEPLPDLSPDPSTLLLAGKYTLMRVTENDKLILADPSAFYFFDPTNPDRVAGLRRIASIGDPKKVALRVDHNTVFVFTDVDAHGNGSLTTFTEAAGAKLVSAAANDRVYAASVDGTRILYSTNAGSVQFDLILGAGGQVAPMTLAAGISALCYTTATFAGDKLVARHCPPHHASPPAQLVAYDLASGSATPLLADAAEGFDIDPAETHAAAGNRKGSGFVIDLGSGVTTPIAADFIGGYFTSDGGAVIYVTGSGGLARFPVGVMKAPLVLQGGGVKGLLRVAPDRKSVLFYKEYDESNASNDVYLASTESASAPVAIFATPEASSHRAGYTRDGAFAFASTDRLDRPNLFKWISVADGKPHEIDGQVDLWQTAAGARLVYQKLFAGDFRVIDLSTDRKPQSFAAGSFYFASVSRDGKTLYYTATGRGIYAAPIP